jgi:hypothetical protein
MKQAISGAITNRKGTMKMTVKNRGKTRAQNHPKNDGTIVAASTSKRVKSRAPDGQKTDN